LADGVPVTKEDPENAILSKEGYDRSFQVWFESIYRKKLLNRIKQKIRQQDVRISFYADGIGDLFSKGPSRVMPFQLNPEVRIMICEL